MLGTNVSGLERGLFMTADKILIQLQTVFADVFGDDDILLTRETSAADVPEWDSMANVLLITTVEKKFAVRFTSREIAGMKCVGDMIDEIEAKRTP